MIESISPRATCRADRLTDTTGGATNVASHSAICRHVSDRTQDPMGMMSRLASATSRNVAGSIRPRSGCSTRRRALTPSTFPELNDTIG